MQLSVMIGGAGLDSPALLQLSALRNVTYPGNRTVFFGGRDPVNIVKVLRSNNLSDLLWLFEDHAQRIDAVAK